MRTDGVWHKVGRIWPSEFEDDKLTDTLYWHRNYDVFAILAEVRNNNHKITPIAEPRDWPKDISAAGLAERGEWAEANGHSFSWHSLRHLLDYPFWTTTFTDTGMLNGPGYATFKKNGRPNEWWSVDGFDERVVTEKHMIRQLALGREMANRYVRASWSVPYKLAAGSFFTETLPRLVALASPDPSAWTMAEQALAGEKAALLPLQDWLTENDRPGLDDVRMVFFFDN